MIAEKLSRHDVFGRIRNAYATRACKDRVATAVVSFSMLGLVSLAAGLWAADMVRWKYAGEVTMIALYSFGLAQIWFSIFRTSPYASGLYISPSYQVKGAQAQFHMGELQNPYAIRTQLRKAIPLELNVLEARGLRSASMDSPLLASDRTRRRLVSEFNSLFETESIPWRAFDIGSQPRELVSFFFVLSYYKASYLQEKKPRLYKLLGLPGVSKQRSNTWGRLMRDDQSKLIWGGIEFRVTF